MNACITNLCSPDLQGLRLSWTRNVNWSITGPGTGAQSACRKVSPRYIPAKPPLCHCFPQNTPVFSKGSLRRLLPGEDGSGGEADALQWRRVPPAQ